MKKNYKSSLCLGRMGHIGIALAVSLSPALGGMIDTVHAAENPVGTTVERMDATVLNASDLKNYGMVLNSSDQSKVFGIFGESSTPKNYTFSNFGTVDIASSFANGSAEARGMSANAVGTHTLLNKGNITVKATGGSPSISTTTNADASAYGMYAKGDTNILGNSGNITVTANGGKPSGTINSGTSTSVNAKAYAYGIYADGNGNKLTNSGNITVIANGGTPSISTNTNTYADVSVYADAHGIYTKGNSNNITNDGNITVTANGGMPIASNIVADAYVNANASAYGIYTLGDTNNITNDGNITVIANAGNPSISINAHDEANADAYGIYALGDINKLTNDDNITVTANGGNPSISTNANDKANAYTFIYGNASAYGMYADGDTNTISNSGNIIVTATSGNPIVDTAYEHAYASPLAWANAEAYGIYAEGDTSTNELTNDGNITVTATAGNPSMTINDDAYAYASPLVWAYANAYGIYAKGDTNTNNTLSNSGNITVTANGGNPSMISGTDAIGDVDANAGAIGIYADGKSNTITNSGDITVTANGGMPTTSGIANADAIAYGIFLSGTAEGDGHFVENTGSIKVDASVKHDTAKSYAYEVYGTQGYNVKDWATTLRKWEYNDAVFGVGLGETVTFKDSNFIARPGSAEEGFEFGKAYKVADMVASADVSATSPTLGAGLVDGTIASVTTDVNFIKATLVDADGNILTDGGDAKDVAIRIDGNVTTDNTPGSTTAMQVASHTQGQATQIARVLEGQDAQDETALAFIVPHTSSFDNSGYNFDGDSVGFTGGINYRANDNFLVGMHFDLTQTNSKAQIMDMSSDIDAYAIGLHANYNISPNWYVNGQFTASTTEFSNGYRMTTSTPLVAKADMGSDALYLALNTGYIWTVAEHENAIHSLTPQIGLSYLNINTDSYTIDWSDPANDYDMVYDDGSFDALYANLNVQWDSVWSLGNDYTLGLNADLGLRQNLSDTEFDTDVNLLGGDFTTTANEDTTTFTAGAGIELQKGNYGFSLNYDGAYGDEQTVHTGKVLFKVMF